MAVAGGAGGHSDYRFWPYPELSTTVPTRRRKWGRRRQEKARALLQEQLSSAPVLPVEPANRRWGICLSGGGVRSASFSLGVLQEMHAHGMIHGPDKATYLSAVSGGSYLAGAAAIVTAGPRIPSPANDPHDGKIRGADAARPAFGAGSPEERLLRKRTRYLTHGSGGPLAAAWRYLMGMCFNLLLVGLAVYVIAKPIGWVYGWRLKALRNDETVATVCKRARKVTRCVPAVSHVHVPSWLGWLALALAGAAVLSGLAWVAARWERKRLNGWFGGASGVLLASAAAVALGGIVIPHALEFIRVALPRHGVGYTPTVSTGKISGATVGSSSQRTLFAGSGIAAALSALTGFGALRAGSAVPPIVQNAEKEVRQVAVSWAKRLAARYRGPLLNLAAAVTGPLLVVFGALLAIAFGASEPINVGKVGWLFPGLQWLIPLVILIVAWRFGDLNVWSLHPFYRHRLAAAYAPRRFEKSEPDENPSTAADLDAEELPRGGTLANLATFLYDERYQRADFPELLICAAANVADYGATPTGSNVTSFVFSEREVGGPLLGAVPTATYAALVGERGDELTVLSAVSVSGAAFSPSMGKMTRAPLRFLLALLNLRLGAWLPNPRRVTSTAVRGGEFRFRSRPHVGYLLREMLGWNRLEARYLYVTDGGHYENLGLIELVRRQCRWIWCVDASGDSIDTFNTIGQALALADAELGVHIDIDPEGMMAPDSDVSVARAKRGKAPLVQQPYCVGRIFYPGEEEPGILVIIKAGVAASAPWEIQSFYEGNPQFPCDPTLNQLYTGERFDAYRALGTWAMNEAWLDCGEEFEEFIKTRPKGSTNTRVDGAATAARNESVEAIGNSRWLEKKSEPPETSE